ncbi:MAG: pyrophosphohydrolase domain-containing protein [Acidiferrobacteraceae bacterium]|jgi:NTP pyrophosphatase (non-canonical NTP hydrolase)
MNADAFSEMLAAVAAFHRKHEFRDRGGEDMVYRVTLMTEELGEIAACVSKGKSKEDLAEECADLLILLIGTAISADFDLREAFWGKMRALERRGSRMVDGRVRIVREPD